MVERVAAAAGVLEKMKLSVFFPRAVRCESRLCTPIPGRFPGRVTVSFLAMVVDLRDSVSTTGNSLVAALALPDTDSLALDGVLSAESADVAGVLGDFHLLHLLTQGGTVSVRGIVRIRFVVEGDRSGFVCLEEITVVWVRVGRMSYLVPYLPVMPTSVENR